MDSVAQALLKLFRGSPGAPETGKKQHSPPRPTRRSSGLAELTRAFSGREELCVLDIGPTSASNIQHFTHLGYKVYSEDILLASKDRDLLIEQDGKQAVDEKRFLAESLSYGPHTFDAVLCWDIADYLDESLVKPFVARMWSVLKPGGLVLGFFHTKDAGPDAPYYRYHIANNDTIELQGITVAPGTAGASNGGSAKKGDRVPAYRLQRVFNNRHIENLFRDYAGIKFFLARDNVREVLVTR
jgi:SAM-dependent methyltransferase